MDTDEVLRRVKNREDYTINTGMMWSHKSLNRFAIDQPKQNCGQLKVRGRGNDSIYQYTPSVSVYVPQYLE